MLICCVQGDICNLKPHTILVGFRVCVYKVMTEGENELDLRVF